MATLFWVGGSTAYDGVTNRLATSSGGSATVAAITSADTVTFDNQSPAGAVVTTSATISCTTLSLATGFTGSLTLSNPLTVSGALTLTQGTLNTNGQACSAGSLVSTGAATRVLTLGASTVTLSGTGTILNMASTGLTLTPGTSTILVTDISASSKTLTGGGLTYANLAITTGGAGAIIIQNNNTFTAFIAVGASTATINFTASSTTTLAGTSFFVGRASNLITVQSTSAATAWNIVKTGPDVVSSDYISVKDSAATPANTWYAGANSTNVSGNSGWLFTVPVAIIGDGALFDRRTEFIYRSIPTIGSGTSIDLWKRYLIAVTGVTTEQSISDLTKIFLRQKGGTGDSTMDLWSSYLLSKGFTQGTIHDRQLAFFNSGTQT